MADVAPAVSIDPGFHFAPADPSALCLDHAPLPSAAHRRGLPCLRRRSGPSAGRGGAGHGSSCRWLNRGCFGRISRRACQHPALLRIPQLLPLLLHAGNTARAKFLRDRGLLRLGLLLALNALTSFLLTLNDNIILSDDRPLQTPFLHFYNYHQTHCSVQNDLVSDCVLRSTGVKTKGSAR